MKEESPPGEKEATKTELLKMLKDEIKELLGIGCTPKQIATTINNTNNLTVLSKTITQRITERKPVRKKPKQNHVSNDNRNDNEAESDKQGNGKKTATGLMLIEEKQEQIEFAEAGKFHIEPDSEEL